MLQCYDEMNKPLQQTQMVQEQLGFGLNGVGQGEKAIAVLETFIKDHDNDPETNSILGRVHKDLWQ